MIDLLADEKIIAVERRHWLPIALQSISMGLAALAPLVFLVGAEFLPFDTKTAIAGYRPLAWFVYATWLLGLWMAFGVSLTNYYLDVLVVTTKRVIDIEQISLFARDLAEIRLDNIEDIHVEINGFIPSLLNYGRLSIQSAGESREFALRHMHDPHRVKEIIFREHDAMKSRAGVD